MIKQSDVEGRLSLLRYGLVVILVVAFAISLGAPYIAVLGVTGETPNIMDFIGTALLITVIVGVVSVAFYFAYKNILERTRGTE